MAGRSPFRGLVGNAKLSTASPPDAVPVPYKQEPFPETFASGQSPLFSPDGTKIGVLIARAAGASESQLWIIPRPNGRPRRVVDLPTSTLSWRRLGWMPDSRHVV